MSARAAGVVVLLFATLAPGCIQAFEETLDDARGGDDAASDEPQESVGDDGGAEANGTADVGGVTPVDPVTVDEGDAPEPAPTTPPSPTPPPVTTAPAPPPPAPTPPAPTAPPATTTPTPSEPTPPSPTPPPPSTPPTPPPPSTTPPPPQPATWPREGSHVSYAMRSGWSIPDGTGGGVTYANVTWTYTNGDWRGACSWQSYERSDWTDPEWRNTTGETVFSASSPPHWPPFNTKNPPAVGERVTVWHLDGCTIESRDMIYSGVQDSRWGRVHDADDERVAEENYSDYDAVWDPETGLVLQWSWARRNSGLSGVVTSTDAPL